MAEKLNNAAQTSEASPKTTGAGNLVLALVRHAAPRYASMPAPEANAQRGLVVTRDGVAVIPVLGFLSARVFQTMFGTFGGKTRRIAEQVREAAANADVETIVLHVDSPGGSVDGISEAAAVIRAARETKRVIAVADTMAGSAAYWLASQADELVVTPSGEVGSIGVFMVHEDWSGNNEKAGIKPTYIYAGANKVEANMDEPLSESAAAHLQASVEHYYDQFTSDVAAGRRVDVSVVRGEAYGQGRAYPAAIAVERGMADRVSTLDEVVRAAGEAPRASQGRRLGVSASLPARRGNFAFK